MSLQRHRAHNLYWVRSLKAVIQIPQYTGETMNTPIALKPHKWQNLQENTKHTNKMLDTKNHLLCSHNKSKSIVKTFKNDAPRTYPRRMSD